MRYKEMAAPAPETTIYKTAADHLRSKGLKAKDPQRARVSGARHLRIENSLKDIENIISLRKIY